MTIILDRERLGQEETIPSALTAILDDLEAQDKIKSYNFKTLLGSEVLNRETDDLDIPYHINLTWSHMNWGYKKATHRLGGKPAYVAGRIIQWFEYNMTHRVDGPAVIAFEEIVNPLALLSSSQEQIELRGQNRTMFFLFDMEIPKELHQNITETHYAHGIPLEIAFLLNLNGGKRKWDIDPMLPLSWQLKLFEKDAVGMTEIKRWFAAKSVIGAELGDSNEA